jgi:hypothetical protein
MISTGIRIEDLTLNITEDIHVRAPLDTTFTALLDQLGPYNEVPSGGAMPMKIEPWPGGRWAVVQAIKRPTLLEFAGPLFMSYPVVSNVQYRLSETNGVTLIKFRHSAIGMISDEHRAGVSKGWGYMNEGVRKRAEAARSH